jgi:multiple sugar transport system ATP-binding protein
VAIARAVVREAGVTLFDEPLANVGAEERDRLLDEIKLLHREYPTTTLYASHDSLEAMTLADRVILLREGRVEQAGTPLELFEKPQTRFVAGFFGWPKMNFLSGTLIRGTAGDSIRIGPDGPEIRLPPNRIAKDAGEQAVVLGIRPEQMMRAVRASPPDGAFRHDAEIEALRLRGSRTYATFRIGGIPVVAELLTHDVTRVGERVPIDINLKRAAIFEALTERAL